MPKRVPISVAKAACESAECRQAILCLWDGELTHIVTYGKTVEDCAQAAQGGNYLKEKWGWPECNDQPSRVKKLQARVGELSEALCEALKEWRRAFRRSDWDANEAHDIRQRIAKAESALSPSKK